jgi:hypothetical protein
MIMETGYYGIPGHDGGRVHLVIDGQPVCGVHIDPRAEFQYCSGGGIHLDYIDCQRCYPIAKKMLEDWLVKYLQYKKTYKRGA